MADGKNLVLGIDVGGTKVLAGVVDENWQIRGRGKVKSPFRGGPAEMTEALVAAADAALAEAGAERKDVTAIGLGLPGPLDEARTTLLRAMNLGVERWEVPSALEPAFPGIPKRLENDVRVAALGEARLGAAKGERLVVAIWVGTGIGGAVVLDGKLWLGRNRNAGEIGQCFVDLKKAGDGTIDGTLEGIGAKIGMTAFMRRTDREGGEDLGRPVRLREGRAPQGLGPAQGARGRRRPRGAGGRALGPGRRHHDRDALERLLAGPLRPGRRRGRGRRTRGTSSRSASRPAATPSSPTSPT